MSWRTKDSRVRITMKRMARDSQLAKRKALWEKRGNNPPNHIGYLDTRTGDILTAGGNYSIPMHISYRGDGFVKGNNTHDRRVAASIAEDYTVYV